MKFFFYYPYFNIFLKKGDIENFGIYYVIKGEVSCYLENKDKCLQNIEVLKLFVFYIYKLEWEVLWRILFFFQINQEIFL